MSTSAIPAVIDALFAASTAALTDVTVSDGFGVSGEPGDYLMVGVDDPDSRRRTPSADSAQDWAEIGHRGRSEQGEVTCSAASWNGDSDQKVARDAAFAIVAAVENLCRADPTLGVATLLWTSVGTSIELQQEQGDYGARSVVIFRVAFRARI